MSQRLWIKVSVDFQLLSEVLKPQVPFMVMQVSQSIPSNSACVGIFCSGVFVSPGKLGRFNRSLVMMFGCSFKTSFNLLAASSVIFVGVSHQSTATLP